MGATGASFDDVGATDLPLYVAVPRPATTRDPRMHDAWRRASSAVRASSERSVAAVVTTAQAKPVSSPCFARLIDLPGADLAGVLPRWWARVERHGVAAVDRHLLLEAPSLTGSTWTLRGHLHHGVLKGVPITVDLWAHSTCFTRVAMAPQVRVATSKRYFEAGNGALDRLAVELAACAGHVVRARPRLGRGRRPR
jgi:hypothetical protein